MSAMMYITYADDIYSIFKALANKNCSTDLIENATKINLQTNIAKEYE